MLGFYLAADHYLFYPKSGIQKNEFFGDLVAK